MYLAIIVLFMKYLASFFWVPIHIIAACVIIAQALFLRILIGKNSFLTKKLLKLYLRNYHQTHRQLLRRLATPLLDGIHPKNVFNKRPEFFIENCSKEDIVLDIACGTARLIEVVAPLVSKAIGIDSDRSTIEKARKRLTPLSNTELFIGDIFSQALQNIFESNNISVVFLSHILEHISDVPTFLKIIKCKRLLVCVPSQDNWILQLMLWTGLNISSDPTHYREYTKKMLVDELLLAEYQVNYIGYNADGEIICEAIKK